MASKPIILTVDDEPQVLNAIDRDLRRHYRNEYRIIKVGSGAGSGRGWWSSSSERGDPVALFLADQRMPDLSGTEFLAEARQPSSPAPAQGTAHGVRRHAALTIDSINSIGLDYSAEGPWGPAGAKPYPVLDDLLSDWWQDYSPTV